MTKLTDTQRAVLTAAASRADGAIQPLPDHLKGGAVTKVLHALIAAGLITQAPCTITPIGRAAVADDSKGTKPAIPAALEKLTVTQVATAIANITGEPVNPKSFNYKDKALERLGALMSEQQLSIQAVLKAAGIEAIAPNGTVLSGLGLKADEPTPTVEQVEVRWSLEFGQEVKLGLLLRRTDLDDEQTEAVFGGVQGEGSAGGAAR